MPEVLVPRRHRPVPGIVIRSCRRLDPRDVTTCRGIPVTTVARMLVDLSDVLTPHQLAYVIKEAAYRKRLRPRRDAAGRRARATAASHLDVLERAIELYLHGSAGTKSPHEDAFLALLPPTVAEPLVNTQLAGFEVDFLWPEQRLVVEIDGGGHERPTARRKDALEDRVLRARGLSGPALSPTCGARAAAGGRPRPPRPPLVGDLEADAAEEVVIRPWPW